MISDSILGEFHFSQLFSFLRACQWIGQWVHYFSRRAQFSFVLVLEEPRTLFHLDLLPPWAGGIVGLTHREFFLKKNYSMKCIK